MRLRSWLALISLSVMCAQLGCGSSDDGPGDEPQGGSGGTAGAAGAGAEGGSDDSDTGGGGSGNGDSKFDPANPGIKVGINIMALEAMAQPVCVAAGMIEPAVREDVDRPPEDEIPLETCVDVPESAPSCTSKADCYPEQDCVPSTDREGKAIPNTEHCATARSALLNVGPIEATGFAAGPTTMSYNPGQSGLYTIPGSSDGTVDCSVLGYNQTYTFHGAGSADVGLGEFGVEFRMGPVLQIVSPSMTALPSGVDGVVISATSDLVVSWSGSEPGAVVKISLSGATMGGESHTVACRTLDTGTFTIPGDKVRGIKFGVMAMLNQLIIERTNKGEVLGSGVTAHDAYSSQQLIILVSAQ